MENTKGVAAEGGVGVAMFDRGKGLLLGLSALFLCRGWLDRHGEVPRWRG